MKDSRIEGLFVKVKDPLFGFAFFPHFSYFYNMVKRK